VRPKKIFQLTAVRISPHFIYLDLVTQAGTYIKEFVHGDLGRTTPSLQDLLGIIDIQCDILLLDGTFSHSVPKTELRENWS
jgi:tRNA pseudouridine synthase 10